ncbi:MAG: GtrA family protein [bacterium]|nr:GtrA family protein [bacterium]
MAFVIEMLRWKFVRYGLVGILNLTLSIGIFNVLIWSTGITRGIEITFFSIVTFAIVVTHSFFWNKLLVFKSSERAHREYVLFFTVSSSTSLLNVGIISFLVNGLGAPAEITPTLWANIAVLLTIPVSVLGNFFGYKLLVFRESDKNPIPEEEQSIV